MILLCIILFYVHNTKNDLIKNGINILLECQNEKQKNSEGQWAGTYNKGWHIQLRHKQ